MLTLTTFNYRHLFSSSLIHAYLPYYQVKQAFRIGVNVDTGRCQVLTTPLQP